MIVLARLKINDEIKNLVKEGKIILVRKNDIPSKKVIESAYLKAKRSFERGTNISRDIETETILYVSGERQISKAMEKYGLNGDDLYYIIQEDEILKKIEIVEENEEKEKIFDFLERVALLEIKK